MIKQLACAIALSLLITPAICADDILSFLGPNNQYGCSVYVEGCEFFVSSQFRPVGDTSRPIATNFPLPTFSLTSIDIPLRWISGATSLRFEIWQDLPQADPDGFWRQLPPSLTTLTAFDILPTYSVITMIPDQTVTLSDHFFLVSMPDSDQRFAWSKSGIEPTSEHEQLILASVDDPYTPLVDESLLTHAASLDGRAVFRVNGALVAAPEPSSWILLASGLFLVQFTARRR